MPLADSHSIIVNGDLRPEADVQFKITNGDSRHILLKNPKKMEAIFLQKTKPF